MSVNKYKIRVNREDKFLNVPLTLTNGQIGQEDIIENTYVASETERVINDIVDYEKVRLHPNQEGNLINRVDYSVNLLKDGFIPEETTYGGEGFTNDDIKYRRNNFKRSFLNLMFYDSDIPTNQNYVGNITMFSKLSRFDLMGDRGPYDSTEGSVGDGGNGSSDELIKATFDEGASDDGLFLGHNCSNIIFPQRLEYILDGDTWKTKTTTTWGNSIPECSVPHLEEGVRVPQSELPEGIEIASFFVHVQKVTTDYTLPGKRGTYSVYVVWGSNLLSGTSYPKDVWLSRNSVRTITVNTVDEPVTRTFQDESGNVRSIDDGVRTSYNVTSREGSTRTGSTTVGRRDSEGTRNNTTSTRTGSDREGSSDGGAVRRNKGNDLFSETNITGIPNDVNAIPIRFIVENPITMPRGFSEGYYLYHEKSEIATSLFMRATFNNAKNGLSTDLMTTNEPQDISEVLNKIHVKYDLKIDGDIYYYEIDTTYSDNILIDGDRMVIKLYEIQVL